MLRNLGVFTYSPVGLEPLAIHNLILIKPQYHLQLWEIIWQCGAVVWIKIKNLVDIRHFNGHLAGLPSCHLVRVVDRPGFS